MWLERMCPGHGYKTVVQLFPNSLVCCFKCFCFQWRCWKIRSLHRHWCQHWAVWGGRRLWRLWLLEEDQGPSPRPCGDTGKFLDPSNFCWNPDRTQFERIISVFPVGLFLYFFLTICERYKRQTVWPGNRATGIYLFCRAGCHDSCDLFIHSCFSQFLWN